jgi:hypothetical protein
MANKMENEMNKMRFEYGQEYIWTKSGDNNSRGYFFVGYSTDNLPVFQFQKNVFIHNQGDWTSLQEV